MAAQAPSTRAKLSRLRPRALTPEEKERRKRIDLDVQDILVKDKQQLHDYVDKLTLENLKFIGLVEKWIGTNESKVVRFFYLFWSPHSGGDSQWSKDFHYQWLKAVFDVTNDQVYDAARHFYHQRGSVGRRVAFRLLTFCARDGHDEASVFVAHMYLKRAKTRPAILRIKEAVEARERLKKAGKNNNFRALVLEGKYAQHVQDYESAARYYQLSMQGAIEFAKQKINPRLSPFLAMQQYDELSSPWIELGWVLYKLGRQKEGLRAYRTGMDMDDPEAFYVVANNIPDYEFSPDWLYNMSKAAASGHYRAALLMGEYYVIAPAHQVPGDLEDESDGVSAAPTPEQPDMHRSLGQRIVGAILDFYDRPAIEADPYASLPYYAAFAQTPQQRIELALEWFKVAMHYRYGAAYLACARILLNKYIFPSQNYVEPVHPSEQNRTHMPGGVDNPFFDIQAAHDLLADVFEMEDALADGRSGEMTKEEEEDQQGEWGLFPEVADQNISEMNDPNRDPVAQARYIADKLGMDITNTNGAVVYFHRGNRGKGVLEKPRV